MSSSHRSTHSHHRYPSITSVGRWLISAFCCISAWATTAPQVSYAQANTISGATFNDANANGVRDAGETGISAVTVTAFTAGATPISTATDAEGRYALTVSSNQTRIEFTNWPAPFQSSVFGPKSGTSVQFVNAPATEVNFGLFNPAQYCQNNARVVGNCFVFGDNVNGADKARATVRSFSYDASGVNTALQTTEATAQQVGATYGIAYQRASRSLFVSAYTKRAASYGPGIGQALSDGTGTIYRIPFDGAPNDAVPFIDLDMLVGTDVTGANPHTDLRPDAPDFDFGAFDAVGKTAFGDLDIGEDDATLWAMNLKLRALVRIPIGYNAQVPSAAQVGNYFVPDPNCPNGVGRPFAIKPYGGLIYVGGVCTAENGGSAADLSAYVYTFNPNTNIWAGPVLQLPLNYNRGCADIFVTYPVTCRANTQGTSANWNPWRDTVDAQFPNGFEAGFTSHPVPMLTDIEFIGSDMVLGLRDRFADQVGYIDPGPFGSGYRNPYDPGDTTLYDLKVIPGGDVLRASRASEGQWQIESNSRGAGFGPSLGANNNEGPGGGEFFWGDVSVIDGKTVHDESALGALAQLPGQSELLMTAADPVRLFTGGVAWLSHSTGGRTRGYEVYGPEQPGTFRKTNGMGDIEVLCDAAPLEIGNRVWLDANEDGVQDPNEPPLPNVLVKLTDANGVVTTTVTNAKGEYTFAALPGQSYTLSIDVEQRALTDLTATLANADATANGDARDSDGVLEGALTVIRLQTGGPGAVNHTYDFGFAPPLKYPQVTPRLILQKLVNDDDANTPTGPVVSVGSVVTWTYRITNSGDVTLTNVLVTDDKEGLICAGLTLAPGQSVTCTKTGVAQIGQYVNTGIVTGTNQISTTQLITATDIAHYFGALEPKPSIRIKKYTNGVDADAPPGPAVRLGDVVTWTYEVQNTGGVTLTNVSVSDDVIGPIACPKTVLLPGEQMLCTKTGIATLGQYHNVGTATGTNELVPSELVTSVDASHYFGGQELPAGLGDFVWLDANRDGLQSAGEVGIPGITVTLYRAGSSPVLRPVLTTTTNAQGYYSFTQLLPDEYFVGFVPPRNYVLTAQGQDDARADDSNANTQTGLTRPVTLSAGEFNPTIDAGVFTTNPAIEIKKYVNGNDADTAPGPIVLATAPVTWTYIITNTGDVTLTRIKLSDDKIGIVICPLTELAPGQSMLCQAAGKVTAGQYANLGTVTGYDQLLSNCTFPSTCDVTVLTDSDPAHYFGAGPQLVIVKSVTPGAPMAVAPGQAITYTLRITNTGNFTATGVMVRDTIPVGATYIEGSAQPPPTSGPDPLVWNLGTLAPNQSATVSFAVRVRNELTVTAIVNRAQAWSAELGIVESNLVASVLAQTAVTLADFRVVRHGDANKVVWQTSGEVNTFGFAVYRAEGEDRASAVLLSKELLTAKGGGSGYAFVDEAAQADTRYHYWLVELESDGGMNEYGPVALLPTGEPSGVTSLAVAASVAANVAAGGVPVILPIQHSTNQELPARLEELRQVTVQAQVAVGINVVKQLDGVVIEPIAAVEPSLQTHSARPPINTPSQIANQPAAEPMTNHTAVVEPVQPSVVAQVDEAEPLRTQQVGISASVVDEPAHVTPNAANVPALLWQALGVMLAMGLAAVALGGTCLGLCWRAKMRFRKL